MATCIRCMCGDACESRHGAAPFFRRLRFHLRRGSTHMATVADARCSEVRVVDVPVRVLSRLIHLISDRDHMLYIVTLLSMVSDASGPVDLLPHANLRIRGGVCLQYIMYVGLGKTSSRVYAPTSVLRGKCAYGRHRCGKSDMTAMSGYMTGIQKAYHTRSWLSSRSHAPVRPLCATANPGRAWSAKWGVFSVPPVSESLYANVGTWQQIVYHVSWRPL